VKDNIIIEGSWPFITFPQWDNNKFFTCFIYYLIIFLEELASDVGVRKMYGNNRSIPVRKSMLFPIFFNGIAPTCCNCYHYNFL